MLAARGQTLRTVRRSMQTVFQDPYSSLNPLMSVGEAVSEAAFCAPTNPTPRSANLRRAGVSRSWAVAALDRPSAPRALRRATSTRRHRTRAMAVNPELLIADEAVSALDVSVQAQVLNLFAELRDERGIAALFIAHDLSVVASNADRVAVMHLWQHGRSRANPRSVRTTCASIYPSAARRSAGPAPTRREDGRTHRRDHYNATVHHRLCISFPPELGQLHRISGIESR